MASITSTKAVRARRRRTTTRIPSQPVVPASLILARRLDLLAGIELQHGHVAAGERLSHQAAQLRGWA